MVQLLHFFPINPYDGLSTKEIFVCNFCALHEVTVTHRLHVQVMQPSHLRWKELHNVWGTKLVPSLQCHFTTGAIGYSFSGSGFQFEAPVMSSVVSLDDCKNPRKPCCSWFRTTSGCIDCFFWAPSYGTSDDDDLDLLFWYDFLIERSQSERGFSINFLLFASFIPIKNFNFEGSSGLS